MKFCAKCGKKGGTIEGLCDKCYSDVHPSLQVSKDIVIKICGNCKRAFHRNRWSRYSGIKEAVKSIVKENLKTTEDIKIKETKEEKIMNANIDIKKTGEMYEIPIKIETVICEKCGKESGDYFEGVLQLRNVDPKIMNYVTRQLDKKYKEGIFVKDVKEVKNGVDIKLTSQKYIQVLAGKLKKRFKGSVKTTRKLFTRNKQTSKAVYRVTVLYKQED